MIAVFRPRQIDIGADWSRTAVTRDGVPYRVRPIRRDDAQREREFLRTLSDQARYAADDSSGSCEFALAVADAWQDRGVGATLLSVLLEYARAAGMKRTFGTIHQDNARMVELAHWLGMQTHADRADPCLLVASRSLD